jgi:hypothetical protein
LDIGHGSIYVDDGMDRCLSCGTLEIKVYLNEMHGLDVVIADLCYPRTKKYARELRRLPLFTIIFMVAEATGDMFKG